MATLDTVFHHLESHPPEDEAELERTYRRLIRQLHPDNREHGTSSDEFIRFTQLFTEYRSAWHVRRRRAAIADGFDPFTVLLDLGVPRDIGARGALLSALYRFRALGLTTWSIRSKPALKQRNTRVLRTVLYWAWEYDPDFVEIFHSFLLQQGNVALVTGSGPVYSLVRRTVLKGLDDTIRFHDRGHSATAAIARDHLAYARMLARPRVDDAAFGALDRFAMWLLQELESEPVRIGLGT
jgi:hypothetical protein